jgi:Zn-finger nucleic acid-binding protein
VSDVADVEVRRCPVCGAPVAAGARSCDYCSAPLASVRCAGCFALSPADAIHCAGCGSKLGLEPLDAAVELACPRCRTPFRGYGAGSGTLCECERCGGQFVEHALLTELLERRELHRTVPRELPPRQNPLNAPVRYLECPVCSTLMNRNNFGGTSGIVVDVCSRHGVWFDPGELPRILEFVQAGGLERARERQELERKRTERDQRLQPAAMATPSQVLNDPYGWSSLADAALDLLDFIVVVLRK